MLYLLSTITDLDYTQNGQAYKRKYTHRALPIAQKYGVGLELTEFCISAAADRTQFKHFKENADGVDLLCMHAPYNELFPHAIEPKLVKICRERFDFCYKLCEEYNIKKLVVHANYVQALYFKEWYVARQVKFWKEFFSSHSGACQIVLENTMENDPRVILDVITGVEDRRLAMCLDIGHANLHDKYSVEQWIDICAPYISHIHIHNNFGMQNAENGSAADLHNPLGEGVIDYVNILRHIEDKTRRELTATIESIRPEESLKWLREHCFLQ